MVIGICSVEDSNNLAIHEPQRPERYDHKKQDRRLRERKPTILKRRVSFTIDKEVSFLKLKVRWFLSKSNGCTGIL